MAKARRSFCPQRIFADGQCHGRQRGRSLKKDDDELKTAPLSDTHYLSHDLIKGTEDFTAHLNSDRKMLAKSDAILTALLETIRQDAPDVLLISEDLIKDGEKKRMKASRKSSEN